MLDINVFNIKIRDNIILSSARLQIVPGTINSLTGSNGQGKSTLVKAILNNNDIQRDGKVTLDEIDITNYKTFEIIRSGIYVSVQSPIPITGVKTLTFLREEYLQMIYIDNKLDPVGFKKKIEEICKELEISNDLIDRELHVGFSGGESKKLELIQLILLKPKYAILDEIDTGLDANSKKILTRIIKELAQNGTGFLVISHDTKFLNSLHIDKKYIINEKSIQ